MFSQSHRRAKCPLGHHLRTAVLVLCGYIGSTTGVLAAEGARFVDKVFESVDLTIGVPFGSGRREAGPDQALLMDVYTPTGDPATARPVIILAFPGGFTSGSRASEGMVFLANEFARRGYVAATIDYRLIEGRPDSRSEIMIAILQAIHDLKAAVRFFREDAATDNRFRASSEHIFAGGISAGAVMAAVAGALDAGDRIESRGLQAFLDANGGIDGNSSDNLAFSSAVVGVLQISGAVLETDWVDPTTAPFYAAHEEFDPIVPCGRLPGVAFVEFGVFITSSGACEMVPTAQAAGVPTGFFFDAGSLNHIGYSAGELEQITQSAAQLFNDEVLAPLAVVSALLPASRAVQVGSTATVFAALVNTAPDTLLGCRIVPMTPFEGAISVQPTDGANNPDAPADLPVSIPAGGVRNFIVSLSPTEPLPATELFFRYECEDARAAPNAQGLNSLLFAASESVAPDIIGLTTVVDLLAPIDQTSLFAVGSANVGSDGAINVQLDDGGRGLPLNMQLCATNALTGACLSDPEAALNLQFEANTTASFAVFVTPSAQIENNPARNRIFVRFTDTDGAIRGATSAAVRTQ